MTHIKLPKHVMDKFDAGWTSRYSRAERRHSASVDQELEQLRAHRNNIQRYRRLLRTKVSDLERQFIERRLLEETSAAQRLAADIPPLIRSSPPPVDRAALGEPAHD